MAKGDICFVTNCKNKITHKGTVCGTHKWRMTKYKSYDLPEYNGPINYYQKKTLPKGILKNCKIHGYLCIEKVYIRYYKGSPNYACKLCVLNRQMKIKFDGLTENDYQKMLLKQNSVCAICKKPERATRNGKIKKIAIDHCHTTKKIRGLLCQFCNALIGYSEDSIEILESAIQYLKDANKNQSSPANPQPSQNTEPTENNQPKPYEH